MFPAEHIAAWSLSRPVLVCFAPGFAIEKTTFGCAIYRARPKSTLVGALRECSAEW